MKKVIFGLFLFFIIAFPVSANTTITFHCTHSFRPGQQVGCAINASENILDFGVFIQIIPTTGTNFTATPGEGFIMHTEQYGDGHIVVFEHINDTGGRHIANIQISASTEFNEEFIRVRHAGFVFVTAREPERLHEPSSNQIRTITSRNLSFQSANNVTTTTTPPFNPPPVTTRPVTTNRATTTRAADGNTNNSSGTRVFIKNLEIEGHEIDFDSQIFNYRLALNPDETYLTFNIELEEDDATYRIEGNEDLSNNSIVRIIVTSSDGREITYQIRIISESNILDTIQNFVIDNVLYIVIPIGSILFLIILVKIFKGFKERRMIKKSSL